MDRQDSAGTRHLAGDWAAATRHVHVAVCITSLRSGLLVDVNDAFCRLFQRERPDIVGRSTLELGLWQDPQQRQRLQDLLKSQSSVPRFEARYRNGRGDTGAMEISASVVEQGDERFVIAWITEVTDRHEFVEGLRVAQARLGVVLRASHMLVFRQDLDLRYTWVANPALGASESDLIGRSDDEIMGPEAAAPLVAIKRRVLQSGQAERRDVWVANNGQLGCFDLVVDPERDAAGRLVGILCAAQDITQRMTARRDLDGPVQAIQGMAALMGREPLSPRQRERVQRIDGAAQQLAGPEHPIPAAQRLRERHAGAQVVVAEQNPVLRELVGSLLEQAGLRVALAGTGVQAFSQTLQLRPALLLLDMDLPQSGGVAAARAVRAMAGRPLPIVAMLSPGSPLTAARALDADLDDVLDRPVVATQLYEKVLTWLDSK